MDADWAFGTATERPYRDKQISISQLDTVLETFPTRFISTLEYRMQILSEWPLQWARSCRRLTACKERVFIPHTFAISAYFPPRCQNLKAATWHALCWQISRCPSMPDQSQQTDALVCAWNEKGSGSYRTYTPGEARSKTTLEWDKEARDYFRSQGKAYIILIGINDEAKQNHWAQTVYW